jgi:hypothetical protein
MNPEKANNIKEVFPNDMVVPGGTSVQFRVKKIVRSKIESLFHYCTVNTVCYSKKRMITLLLQFELRQVRAIICKAHRWYLFMLYIDSALIFFFNARKFIVKNIQKYTSTITDILQVP